MKDTPEPQPPARPLDPSCHSYLLRLWSEGAGTWQASLQDARTGEKHQFSTLKDLLFFMTVKTEEMRGDEGMT